MEVVQLCPPSDSQATGLTAPTPAVNSCPSETGEKVKYCEEKRMATGKDKEGKGYVRGTETKVEENNGELNKKKKMAEKKEDKEEKEKIKRKEEAHLEINNSRQGCRYDRPVISRLEEELPSLCHLGIATDACGTSRPVNCESKCRPAFPTPPSRPRTRIQSTCRSSRRREGRCENENGSISAPNCSRRRHGVCEETDDYGAERRFVKT